MLALFDSRSEFNTIHLIFVKEQGFFIRPIDIKTQKIDNTMLNTYEIVFVAFLVTDQVNQVRFFEKTFLITNISLEIVFGMLFLILNSANINLLEQNL